MHKRSERTLAHTPGAGEHTAAPGSGGTQSRKKTHGSASRTHIYSGAVGGQSGGKNTGQNGGVGAALGRRVGLAADYIIQYELSRSYAFACGERNSGLKYFLWGKYAVIHIYSELEVV
jgi:hypothetical protein